MRIIETENGTAYECVHHKNYFITKTGYLYSIYLKGKHGCTDLSNPHLVKYGKDKDGYYRVVLCNDSQKYYVKVHTLVVQQFIGDIPFGMIINHIDGDKHNNNVENLEIVSVKRNNIHAHQIGLCGWDVHVDVEFDNDVYHFNTMKACSEMFPILSRDYLFRLRNGIVTTRSIYFKRQTDSSVSKIEAYFNSQLIGVYQNMQKAGLAFGLSKGSVSGAIKEGFCAKELNKYHVTFPGVSTIENTTNVGSEQSTSLV